jgi:hypothetical protein
MRFVAGTLTCLGAASLLAACGSSPARPAAAAPAPVAAAAAAPVMGAAMPVGATTASTPRPAPPEMDQKEKILLSAGYKPETRRDGTQVWCRREEVLGSRVEGRKNCGTEQEVLFYMQETRERVDQVQRQQIVAPTH